MPDVIDRSMIGSVQSILNRGGAQSNIPPQRTTDSSSMSSDRGDPTVIEMKFNAKTRKLVTSPWSTDNGRHLHLQGNFRVVGFMYPSPSRWDFILEITLKRSQYLIIII